MGSVLLVEEEVLLPLGPSMALRSHRAMRLGWRTMPALM
jgi:hypothetical protein